MEDIDLEEFETYTSFEVDTVDKEIEVLKKAIDNECKKLAKKNSALPKEIRIIFRDLSTELELSELTNKFNDMSIEHFKWVSDLQARYSELWDKFIEEKEKNSAENREQLEKKIEELEEQIARLTKEKEDFVSQIEKLKEENLNIKSKSLLAFFRRRDEESANDGI